jgi:hypothetical protein
MSRLAVVDLDSVDPETRRRLLLDRDGTYEGPFTAEALSHLAYLAREREQRDQERLAHLLATQSTIGAFVGGPA